MCWGPHLTTFHRVTGDNMRFLLLAVLFVSSACFGADIPNVGPPPVGNPLDVWIHPSLDKLGAIVGAVASFSILAIIAFRGVKFLNGDYEKEHEKAYKDQEKRIEEWEKTHRHAHDYQKEYDGDLRDVSTPCRSDDLSMSRDGSDTHERD